MFIYSNYTDNVIDLGHFDELSIVHYDEDGYPCDFDKAKCSVIRAEKHVESGKTPAWTVIYESADYSDCVFVLRELISLVKKGSSVVEIAYKNFDNDDLSPVVREFR